MSSILIISVSGKNIHLSAISDFFEQNPDMTPEQIALELQHVRECLLLNPGDSCSVGDIQKTYQLITDLIILFREM